MLLSNQLKSSYRSSRLVKEGTGEVCRLKEQCCGVRDKIDKSNKSVLRAGASIEGRLCISTTVKVEKNKIFKIYMLTALTNHLFRPSECANQTLHFKTKHAVMARKDEFSYDLG